jgi:hypothetical protein
VFGAGVRMRISLRQNRLDLRGGDHRQKTHEQAEHREEEPAESQDV